MTEETKELPLPLKINEEIAAKQQELADSIKPLAQEATVLLNGLKESGEFKRVEEIMNSIPQDHQVAMQLRACYNQIYQTIHQIFLAYPPADASPESLMRAPAP